MTKNVLTDTIRRFEFSWSPVYISMNYQPAKMYADRQERFHKEAKIEYNKKTKHYIVYTREKKE